MVAIQHPVFSSAGDRDNPELRAAWLPVLRKHRVALVLQGHDRTHARERAANGVGIERDGSGTMSVTSVAGARTYEIKGNRCDGYADQDARLERTGDNTQFYRLVEIDSERLSYAACTATGERYDAFTIERTAAGPMHRESLADPYAERSHDNTKTTPAGSTTSTPPVCSKNRRTRRRSDRSCESAFDLRPAWRHARWIPEYRHAIRMAVRTFLYFAYGSNLLSARLRGRTPSARKAGNATLPRFRLEWHKIGCDATGKCDVVFTGQPTDRVHGVAWVVRRSEMAALDYHEELDTGYYACKVPIVIGVQRRLARTYRAIPVDPDLRPLDWYKRFVVEGAREHCLPEDYVARLALTPAQADTDRGRRARNFRVR